MSLRVHRPVSLESMDGTTTGDDYGSRIAKLIPAEALGLYGSAVALVNSPNEAAERAALWVIVLVCCVLTVVIRYRATLDPATKRPQWKAIIIALVSFLLWLTALGPRTSPIPVRDDFKFAGALAALLWGTMVPYFYKGE